MAPEDRHSGLPGGGGGADVKAGTEVGIADGASRAVTFGTAFASTPTVVASLITDNSAVDVIICGAFSTTGFSMRVHKGHGGSGHTWDVAWIATDAGDP